MKTKTYILKCPHCGSEKKVTFSTHITPDSEYTMWSDYRIDCEGWMETIHTQQCPSCRKFYNLPRLSDLRTEEITGCDNGQLSYATLKLAISELSGDELAEPWARLESWRAYNALYQKIDDIPIKEQDFNRANMLWLVDFHSPRAKWFSLLIFELNRLLGNKDVCEQMLEAFTYDAFIKKTKIRDFEKGIQREYHAYTMKRRYANQIGGLRFALTLPRKTYNLNNMEYML